MRPGGVSMVAMETDSKRLCFVVFLILCITQVTTAQGSERKLGRVISQFDPVRALKDIPQGSASLAFVFDITGSMYDDLVQVIEGAARILATTLARREKPLYNYVLVPFHDPEIGPVTVTTDPIEFQQELRDLYVQGGGDCPEMSIGAIRLALQQSLPNSFIYVFTDARAKDYMLTESVLSLIQNKQSQVVFVMTGDCGNTSHDGFKAYEQIASTSSGQVFLLQKSQVNQVLNFVRVAVQSRKVNLLSTDRDEGDVQKYDLPVDDALKELTVSVSGERPYIKLINPAGEEVNELNGLNKLLKIKKAQIVGIKNPMPGMWKLIVKSESAHTLRVTGLSSLDFVHGFSRTPTLNMKTTSHRPVQGIPTYILLNATDLVPPGRMTKLELLNLYGQRLVEVPLVLDTNHPSLYNVSGFVPPNKEFFYVKVEGIDSKGYQFWRTAPTAITVIIPGAPEVQMPETTYGFYDTKATLLCQVDSLVPYSVQWSKDGAAVGQQLYFSESRTVQYRVESASIFSEGVYMCNASNAAGSAIAQTFLDIKGK
ncbi:hemicentin-1-like [Lineus longissimus]|uniref:hemicentin-1-like n=1 Tax=Lineus longissimus TaxID=88925 RepID=UPI00315D6756